MDSCGDEMLQSDTNEVVGESVNAQYSEDGCIGDNAAGGVGESESFGEGFVNGGIPQDSRAGDGHRFDEVVGNGKNCDKDDVDFACITMDKVKQMVFMDLDAAFDFYDRYAMYKGFGARRCTIRRNRKSEVIQQTFVCHCEGFRQSKFLKMENRKRRAKRVTRCGCYAKIVIELFGVTGLWCVKEFNDDHNHDLIREKYVGKLSKHRKMQEADVVQMHTMREAGIPMSQIYGGFAKLSGGYKKVGFKLKDMHNVVTRQRKLLSCDAKRVMGFFREMRSIDPGMFWSHSVDADGRLENLFWSDGISRLDYDVFGDVLAFDATYKRNKYMCPLVVFCGVNHHRQNVIFACAIVQNETEETYVWVLEQFMTAMNGKTPVSVITDGDVAMKNAIGRVFPNARHRLCSWHLLQNVGKNVNNKEFGKRVKKFMFGNLDVAEFEDRWEELITELGLKQHAWVQELYEKRRLWATAYMRGSFFAGFRTTSRCESLNSLFKKYVHWKHDLNEFLVHFDRCLTYIRSNEFDADFESSFGEPVTVTHLRSIEKSAAKVYTVSVYEKFCDVIRKSSHYKVVCCHETPSCSVYIVKKFCDRKKEWHVSYHSASCMLKCSCQMMECDGIPCQHIVNVMVYVDVEELPGSLVLNSWTKSAKSIVEGLPEVVAKYSMPSHMCRVSNMWGLCRQFTMLTCEDDVAYNEGKEKMINEIQLLKANRNASISGSESPAAESSLKNPNKVQYKGCGASSSKAGNGKRISRCSICRLPGHYKSSCPMRSSTLTKDDIRMSCNLNEVEDQVQSDSSYESEDSEYDDDYEVNLEDDNVSWVSGGSCYETEDTE